MKNANLLMGLAAAAVIAAGAFALTSGEYGNMLSANVFGTCDEYVEGQTYNYGNTVYYNGGEYQCVWDSTSCTNNGPGQTAGWRLTDSDVSHCGDIDGIDSVAGDFTVGGTLFSQQVTTDEVNANEIDAQKIRINGVEVDPDGGSSVPDNLNVESVSISGDLSADNNQYGDTFGVSALRGAGPVRCGSGAYVIGIDFASDSRVDLICAEL